MSEEESKNTFEVTGWPKKKKKYLYIDKFTDYALINELRLSKVEKSTMYSNIAIIALSVTIALLVIFK